MLLLDEARLAAARETLSGALRSRLQQEAALALALPTSTVLDKTAVPPSGDKRDYTSFGPYWWPNPDTADGLPYVRRDGERNPETRLGDQPALAAMCTQVSTLALAGYYLEDPAAARDAARRLRAWFLDEGTAMRPHLEYGQAVPGLCDGRGIGIIDTVSLRLIPDLTVLLAREGAWSQEDNAALRQWFSCYTQWLLTSGHGRTEANEHNNHGSWYDAQVATFGLYSGHDVEAENTLSRVAELRLSRHIAPDGSQPFELARTLSLSYSVYNLTAFFDLARLGEKTGQALWEWEGAQGQSIRLALEFLRPYLDAPQSWPHPQIAPAEGGVLLALLRRWHARRAGAGEKENAPLPASFAPESCSLPQLHAVLLWP